MQRNNLFPNHVDAHQAPEESPSFSMFFWSSTQYRVVNNHLLIPSQLCWPNTSGIVALFPIAQRQTYLKIEWVTSAYAMLQDLPAEKLCESVGNWKLFYSRIETANYKNIYLNYLNIYLKAYFKTETWIT